MIALLVKAESSIGLTEDGRQISSTRNSENASASMLVKHDQDSKNIEFNATQRHPHSVERVRIDLGRTIVRQSRVVSIPTRRSGNATRDIE
jgi:hypothetical protein